MNLAPCLEDAEPDSPQSRHLTIPLVEYLVQTGGVPIIDPDRVRERIKRIHEIKEDDSSF